MDNGPLPLAPGQAEGHPKGFELLAAGQGRVLGCRRIDGPCQLEHGMLLFAPAQAEGHPKGLELLAVGEGRAQGCKYIGDPC